MLIKKLIEMKDFSETEKNIALFILQRKEDVLHMNIKELAEATYSSNPTIIRFCRKLNLHGYREFKIAFSAELEKQYNEIGNIDINLPFHKKQTYKEVAKSIQMLSNEMTLFCYHELTNEILSKAVHILNTSHKFFLFANGDSRLRADSFKNKCLKINRYAIIANEVNEENVHVCNCSSNDCAIFISYRGNNRSYIKYMRMLKEKNVPTILLTSSIHNQLAKLASVIIPLPVDEVEITKIATFGSHFAIDYILNTLFACLFECDYENNFKIKTDIFNQIENNKLDENH